MGAVTVTSKRTLSSGGKCTGGAVRDNVVDCPAGTVLTGIRIEEGTDHCPHSCNFYSNAIVKYALICRAVE
ncbi:MAG: hypothetical protein PHV55_02955 [Candidatus Omnitrophica bacterium]|nr:hypothetical protein [Candidatus Omnitrophota bacterium]